MKGAIEFDLLESGSSAAHVITKSTRNVKELNVGGGFGTIGVDGEDRMSGQSEIMVMGPRSFLFLASTKVHWEKKPKAC